MPSKYFSVAGSTLLVMLFALGVLFGEEAEPRFIGAFYDSATYAPRLDEAVAELRFARDATPADRIRDVFGQFIPSENKRGKRYSSAATTIIR